MLGNDEKRKKYDMYGTVDDNAQYANAQNVDIDVRLKTRYIDSIGIITSFQLHVQWRVWGSSRRIPSNV